MFFETDNFSAENISAFNISWKKSNASTSGRPFHAISFRIDGNAKFINDFDVLEAFSGDILFVPANCKYHIEAGAEQLFVIHFTSDKPLCSHIKKFTPILKNVYRQYFEDIFNVWSKKEPGYEYECKSIFYKIITSIERESGQHSYLKQNHEIQEIIKYIHQNFTNHSITVKELSEKCFMSEPYFRKNFANVCGCSPLEYINNLRLTHALDLLNTKYYTVSEVSELCGFATPYYFSNFIKNKTGHSPSEFIKNGKE